ncbi:hypothetical protein BGX31_008741 [Mortierella sp. GBA43]|nr:hypothetical protein BGX31_008741 [Mortierella sp. GBA43]
MTDHHTTERLSADRHQDEVAVALFVRCDTAATESQTTRTIINQNLEGSSPSVHLASVSATRDILSDTGDEGPITLNLPTDRSRLPQQSFDNATLPVCFEGPLAISLRSLANEHKTGLDTVLLAAWSMVLSKLSGQDDIVIGVVKDKDNIGNLPLRIDLSGDPSGVQLFGRLKLAIESAEVERASLNHLHTPPQLQ